MKYFIILILFFSTITLTSQKRQLDSLDIEIQKAANKSNTIEISELIEEQTNITNKYSYKLSLDYAIKGLNIAYDLDDKILLARMYYKIAKIYFSTGQYDQSLESYDKSIKLFLNENFYGSIIFINIDIGNIYYAKKLYDIAKDNYLNAINYAKFHSKTLEQMEFPMSVANNNIGLIYKNLNKYDSALIYFNYGLKLRNAEFIKYLIPHSYNYIADVYTLKNDFQNAEKYYNL